MTQESLKSRQPDNVNSELRLLRLNHISPIDLSNPLTSILGHYGRPNFLRPDRSEDIHHAVDIFAPESTVICAPENGFVVYMSHGPGDDFSQYQKPWLGDIGLLTDDNIFYLLAHLDKESLDIEIKKIFGVNGNPVRVSKGDQIAKVGKWNITFTEMCERGFDIQSIPLELLKAYQQKKLEFGPHLHLEAYDVVGIEIYKDRQSRPVIDNLDRFKSPQFRFNPLLAIDQLSY